MTPERKENTKTGLAIACTVCAVVIGFIALFVPPCGLIDSSVLWFTSQLLIFTATMLGVNLDLGKWGSTKNNNDNNTKEK